MMRVVIADDEKLARERLRRLLSGFEEIEIVGEAGDGRTAAELINDAKPDVAFLDIQMPELTGIQVVNHLTATPHIVFTTAYDQYAVHAFELGAIDYLLKPITTEKLERAVERAADRLKEAPLDAADLDHLKQVLHSMSDGSVKQTRITVRHGQGFRVLNLDSVRLFRAEDRYVTCFAKDGEYIVDMTIRKLVELVDKDEFIQIHRGILVSLPFVQDIQKSPFTKSGYELTVEGVKEPLPIGVTFLPALRRRLGF